MPLLAWPSTWWRRDARTSCQAVVVLPAAKRRRRGGVSKSNRTLTVWKAPPSIRAQSLGIDPAASLGREEHEPPAATNTAEPRDEEIEEICTPSVAADLRRERREQGVGSEESEEESDEGEEEEEYPGYSMESESDESDGGVGTLPFFPSW